MVLETSALSDLAPWLHEADYAEARMAAQHTAANEQKAGRRVTYFLQSVPTSYFLYLPITPSAHESINGLIYGLAQSPPNRMSSQ